MTWNIVNPHDYFIGGLIIGILAGLWLAGMIAMALTFRKDSDKV